MTHTRQYSTKPHLVFSFCALLLSTSLAYAASSIVTGVRNSTGAHRLNEQQLQQLQHTLRHKSGFVELSFDKQGTLTLGNRQHIQGGSATVRELLMAAVESLNLYELESHKAAPDIAFARILESEDQLLNERGQRRSIFQVRLDFADFNLVEGPPAAKASFEIGIALLHELVHGVLKLSDPEGRINQIGDCDAHVNQMRRELGLPERLYYHPTIKLVKLTGRRVIYALLQFGPNPARPQYHLIWQVSLVSPRAKNIAELEKGLLDGKNR